MNRTLNQLIASAALGDAEAEVVPPEAVEVVHEKTASAKAPSMEILGDTEKLASALEFIGRRGVDSFLKTAGSHGDGNVGTNAGNKPGSEGTIDLGTKERGTHVSELASNEAAISYDKRVKAKRTSPALKAALRNKPFADPTLKQKLTNAAAKGDKNIHKTAHDREAIRAELERRAAARRA
jgi:hypothetical protein